MKKPKSIPMGAGSGGGAGVVLIMILEHFGIDVSPQEAAALTGVLASIGGWIANMFSGGGK